MNHTCEFDLDDEQALTYEINDEYLETSSGKQAAHTEIYTLGSCTGYYSCPPQLS